jgi:hypothetical protein
VIPITGEFAATCALMEALHWFVLDRICLFAFTNEFRHMLQDTLGDQAIKIRIELGLYGVEVGADVGVIVEVHSQNVDEIPRIQEEIRELARAPSASLGSAIGRSFTLCSNRATAIWEHAYPEAGTMTWFTFCPSAVSYCRKLLY